MIEQDQKPYGVIYYVFNTRNGKCYVGQTVQEEKRRWCQHVSKTRSSTKRYSRDSHLHAAIHKYRPENFERRILFTCWDRETLNESEKYFIAFFGSTDSNIGYNKTFGGEGILPTEETRKRISEGQKGKIVSQETRRLQSIARKGKSNGPFSDEARENIRKSQQGKTLSPEHRLNISIAGLGRKHTEESKRKIGEGHLGVSKGPLSEDHKEKLSISLMGREFTDSHREKISKALTGKSRPESHRDAMRAGWERRKERLAAEKAVLQESSDS